MSSAKIWFCHSNLAIVISSPSGCGTASLRLNFQTQRIKWTRRIGNVLERQWLCWWRMCVKCDLEKFIQRQRFIQFQLHKTQRYANVCKIGNDIRRSTKYVYQNNCHFRLPPKDEHIKCTRLLFREGNDLRIWGDWLCTLDWRLFGGCICGFWRNWFGRFWIRAFPCIILFIYLLLSCWLLALGPTILGKCFRYSRQACLPFDFRQIGWMDRVEKWS